LKLSSDLFLLSSFSKHGVYSAYNRNELKKRQSSPVAGLEWLRGFQEVKAPRFHDNGTGWW